MGLVKAWVALEGIKTKMNNTKPTGNKKPLGSFAAEAALPEEAVLLVILVKSSRMSNLITIKRLLNLANSIHLLKGSTKNLNSKSIVASSKVGV